MSTMNAILLLGSDLGDRNKNLELARTYVDTEVGEIVKVGEIIETEPVGFTSSTMFLNQLIEININLSPIKLLKSIKEIEHKMGRKYTEPLPNEKYVSRIIDIDILQFGGVNYVSKDLVVPHNQIFTRKFVSDLLEMF
ncbi:2-amino-4-hydroxy-6-hydroxymethyldihydropteridine diphosphokinase [Profundicola chukchiensis]|nr:2-amino-4-hydroxy-6-hydroxymethyldihydropteridine diphosphokinase [Profundicola chukchiensis]